MEPSLPGGFRASLRRRFDQLLPHGTQQRKAGTFALAAYREVRRAGAELAETRRTGLVSTALPYTYPRWFRATASTATELAAMRNRMSILDYEPRSWSCSVVVVPGPGSAEDTLRSLRSQLRPAERVEDLRAADDDGLPAVAEHLAAAPDGEFVVVLRAGDVLEPDALLRVLDRADADPRARVVTWDDDVRSGRHNDDPRFRPLTFSADLLLSANPYGRSLALRPDAVRAAGGLRTDLGVDAVWDLLLRMGLDEEHVAHVPRVLGHLCERAPSVGPAGTEVVTEHLGRLGLEGEPRVVGDSVHIRWTPRRRPTVSLLVPTRHNRALIGPLIDTLRLTEYPDWELVVVDNGGRTEENERFYAERAAGIQHRVIWWDRPFNYGAVNNAAAAEARGEVVVLLNDDTLIRSAGWLDELVGWLEVPGVGTVGVQLRDPAGLIQHGGAIIGAAGLADHRFQGLPPHSSTIIGETDWYWDSVANTGACVALRRKLWEDVGGLDERFLLCGSDVVLGLDVRRRGLRNVCTPAIRVDHLESATRSTEVPAGDVFASYWRYARFLRSGDPYHNPNVSLMSRDPGLRAPDEPTALERVGPSLGRQFGGVFHQTATVEEARFFGASCRADDDTVASVRELHARNRDGFDVRSVNWFVPAFDNPFYGGLATIFRIADHLRRHHDVENRFVVWGEENEAWFSSGLAAVFPGLESSDTVFRPRIGAAEVHDLPPADVSIATQWQTAYQVAHFPHTRRKWYLVQDFEPMFHPAGTLYALAEETYKLGLLGLCNTPHLLDLYRSRYDARGVAFVPAVDRAVFHAEGRRERQQGEPLNVFVYARPGHWRNCWELVEPALLAIKRRYGSDVRIVTAGAWASPTDLALGIDHLGLLDYADTGELYRRCDIAVSLTVSEHPSYLPLELMACGVPVVAFDLPAGYWILRDGENCLLARRTVDSLEARISRLVQDAALRRRLADGGVAAVAAAHDDWDENLAGVHAALGVDLAAEGL